MRKVERPKTKPKQLRRMNRRILHRPRRVSMYSSDLPVIVEEKEDNSEIIGELVYLLIKRAGRAKTFKLI